MATETLKEIWLLRHLDAMEISTLVLTVGLVLLGIVTGTSINWLVGTVEVHPLLLPMYPPEVVERTFFFLPAIFLGKV